MILQMLLRLRHATLVKSDAQDQEHQISNQSARANDEQVTLGCDKDPQRAEISSDTHGDSLDCIGLHILRPEHAIAAYYQKGNAKY
jgi:hypothetical protein